MRPGVVAMGLLVATLGSAAWGVEPPLGSRLEIVDRAIDHHGGERYASSETRLSLCSKSGCSTIVALADGGRFALTVTAAVDEGKRRVRITNETVEQWTDGEPVEIPADRRQALRDWVMARVYFAFLPYRLNDPSVYKQDLGLEAWGDRELRRVRVTFAPGSSTDAEDVFVFWLDPETARVEQFAYSYTRGKGGLRFRRGVNYRRIGGILFFDQENLGVDGPGFSVDELDPAFVERMRHVSTVELRDVAVRALPQG